jgi:dTDP-4-dehydrorhamnose 3,5-epimerase
VKITPTALPEVLLIMPQFFADERGFFAETWNQARYQRAGLPAQFVQDNLSYSGRGVLRGLHFQYPQAQGKLIYVLQGEVYDVAVDIRAGSPDFGRWVGLSLSDANRQQLYIPPGFAHGFCVVSDSALLVYKCTAPYNPQTDGGIRWDDPELDIPWPCEQPLLSSKDAAAPLLREIEQRRLPPYAAQPCGRSP